MHTEYPNVQQRRSRSSSKRRPKSYTTFRPLNFEKYAAEANYIINQVADELDIDRNMAARITRAVLHAVRDRLPADDAIQFAQGLPIALKGIFIDQYDLSAVPLRIRHPKEFIDYVYYKGGRSAQRDFPDPGFVEDSIAAVFRVLEKNMDYGQVAQIKRLMNDELGYLMD
jgi:uncharacterized protein (DUF2267 family)